MEGRHHLRPLADRAADTLHRTRTHIANREDARHRSLQRLCSMAMGWNARHYETLPIKRNAATLQPAGRGIGADEQEQVADFHVRLIAREPATDAHALKSVILGALKAYNLVVEKKRDVGRRLNAFN